MCKHTDKPQEPVTLPLTYNPPINNVTHEQDIRQQQFHTSSQAPNLMGQSVKYKFHIAALTNHIMVVNHYN